MAKQFMMWTPPFNIAPEPVKVRVMSVVEGWAMIRRPNAVPFVVRFDTLRPVREPK